MAPLSILSDRQFLLNFSDELLNISYDWPEKYILCFIFFLSYKYQSCFPSILVGYSVYLVITLIKWIEKILPGNNNLNCSENLHKKLDDLIKRF